MYIHVCYDNFFAITINTYGFIKQINLFYLDFFNLKNLDLFNIYLFKKIICKPKNVFTRLYNLNIYTILYGIFSSRAGFGPAISDFPSKQL